MMSVPTSYSYLRVGVFFLGASTLVTQVVCLREVLMLFQGNELTLGLTLALWMTFVALGSLLFRKQRQAYKRRAFLINLIGICVTPVLLLSLLPIVRYALFEPALELGPLALVVLFSLCIGPYCFLAGWVFPWLVAYADNHSDSNHAGIFYSLEALGSLLVGLVINSLLVMFVPAILFLSVLAAGGILFAGFYAAKWHDKWLLFTIPVLVILLAIVIPRLQNPKQYLPYLKDAEEVEIQDTPNGRFIQFTKDGERYYYENNAPLIGKWQPVTAEELVHFGMSQAMESQRVLLIGHMFTRCIDELLKYPNVEIDFYCPDVYFRSQDSLFPALLNRRVHVYWGDPVRSFRRSQERYGLILADVSKPTTVRVNRYYTRSFFRQAKEHLHDEGVYMMHLPTSATYFDKSSAHLIQILQSTLSDVFNDRQYVKAESSYLMASDGTLDYELTRSVEKYAIATNYVFPGMPSAAELQHNSAHAAATFPATPTTINRNLYPVAYFSAIHSWLAQVGAQSQYFWLFPLLIVIAALVFLPVRAFGMFAVGYTASSFEFLLLMAFQVFFGYLYLATGFIIMLFMAGLSYGAYIGHKRQSSPVRLLVLLMVSLIFSLFVVALLETFDAGNLSAVILGFLLLIVSYFVGMLFSAIADEGRKQHIGVGVVYGADMLGSALGALLTAVYVLPGIGFYYTLLGLVVLNGVALVRWNLQKV
ncbi:MAG: hypothetical protein ACQESW_09860 [Bacteroidota bacterium]